MSFDSQHNVGLLAIVVLIENVFVLNSFPYKHTVISTKIPNSLYNFSSTIYFCL